jgi:hypothetical protein
VIDSPREIAPAVSGAEFYDFVGRAVCTRGGERKRLVSLQRRFYDYYSSFVIEELTAVCEDGTRLPLIFKNLSPAGLLAHAREIRPQFNYHPLREIAVYRDILAGAGLGTAACYGVFAAPQRQLYWLLLEKIAGAELSKVGDFFTWCDVAQWLANMHCRLTDVGKQQEQSAHLLRYDQACYMRWIDRAEQFYDQREPANRLKITAPQMKWLAGRCRSAVRHLCSLPTNFLHGDFYASNILIEQRDGAARICPVDWETAAIGTGLIDVAALVAGDWTEQQKEQLATAYYEALPASHRSWADGGGMMKSLRCCRLFLAIRWLGWSAAWQPPPEHRFDWLAEAMRLAETIEAEGV